MSATDLGNKLVGHFAVESRATVATPTPVNTPTPSAACGMISAFAGTGVQGPVTGTVQALAATFNGPNSVWGDDNGHVYVADQYNGVVRKVDLGTGVVSTVAGGGGNFGDGELATQAVLNYPTGVWGDAAGNLYIADSMDSAIRKVNSSGIISTVAGMNGSNTYGYSGDGGAATSAKLNYPKAVWGDTAGNLYISDNFNNAIRKVDTGGTITTIAGGNAPGLAGTGGGNYSGDGGPATAAELFGPEGIWGDNKGDVIFADNGNHAIRGISIDGNIHTFVGNGSYGFAGDGGPAAAALLHDPVGLWGDASGNVFVADRGNARVRRIDNNGNIMTVAGTGVTGTAGDGGLGIAAQLNTPIGVWTSALGQLYIADFDAERVRAVAACGSVIQPILTYTPHGGGHPLLPRPHHQRRPPGAERRHGPAVRGGRRPAAASSSATPTAERGLPGRRQRHYPAAHRQPRHGPRAIRGPHQHPGGGQHPLCQRHWATSAWRPSTWPATTSTAWAARARATGQFSYVAGLASDGSSLWVGDNAGSRVEKLLHRHARLPEPVHGEQQRPRSRPGLERRLPLCRRQQLQSDHLPLHRHGRVPELRPGDRGRRRGHRWQHRSFVADTASNGIATYDMSLGYEGSIGMITPYGVGVSADGSKIYASGLNGVVSIFRNCGAGTTTPTFAHQRAHPSPTLTQTLTPQRSSPSPSQPPSATPAPARRRLPPSAPSPSRPRPRPVHRAPR